MRTGSGRFREQNPMSIARQYDVIVVGARCAGSPTAMLLARKGYRVLLVDRATFPSDTFRNHFIQLQGLSKLKKWGLLDRLLATDCPPIRQFTMDLGDFPLATPISPIDGIDMNLAPRRYVLDSILVEAVATADVEVRDGFSVQEILFEGDQVVGIRGRTPQGLDTPERARLVVGADGLHSTVAKAVNAPVYNAHPALTCAYYSYFAGITLDGVGVAILPDRFLIAFPTNNGLVCAATQVPLNQFQAFRDDVEGSFFRSFAAAPWLAESVAAGTRVERWSGTADLPNLFRKPFGNGWALVGDAGYHKDPLTAQGITDAFCDAELLSNAIDDGFAGRGAMSDAMANYERQRNAAVSSSYPEAVARASFEPFPAELFAQRAQFSPVA